MIYIYEDKRRELSGLTSLYLLFEFNQDVVNVVKSSGTYFYHKDSHTWEVPITSLSYLLDNLCYFDEISLFVKSNDENRQFETLKGEHRTKLYDYQKDGVEFGLNHDKWLLLDSPGLGKAVSLDTLVLTDKGFVEMRDIKVGDCLFDDMGKKCHVLNTFSHKDLNMYRITFTDNSFVDCCEDHLWQFSYNKVFHKDDDLKRIYRKRVNVVKDTKWIVTHNWKANKLVFPRCSPVQFDKKNLSIHPYVLGCLLGDGSISCGSVDLISSDVELINRVNKYLPTNYYCKKRFTSKYIYTITSNNVNTRLGNYLKNELKKLGLYGCDSKSKFIPSDYLYSDVNDRIELLRGLLDTDGYASKEGNVLQFSTSSKQLLDGVAFLVESLGGIVNRKQKQGRYKYKDKTIESNISYILTIRIDDPSDLVTLTRKKTRLCKRKFLPRRMIKSIEKIDTHEGKCITVDSKNSLYIIKDFIVTHNTLQMITLAEELKEQRNIKHCLVICGIASLRDNWRKEIQKHSKLDCVLVGERINRNNNRVWNKIPERAKQLKENIDEFFVILNVEVLRNEEIVNAILTSDNQFDMIIFDECHKCVDGDTLVDTTLGKLPIKYIVDNHLDCKVKSYNSKTKSFEFNNILNYHNNGSLSMIQLEILDEKGKLHTIMCTEEHKIYTLNRGWVCAKNLNINEDEIFLC